MSATLTQQVTWRFQPRPYQVPRAQARANGVKRILHVDHRKSGKDLSDLDLIAAETQKQVGQYFYMFPELSEARKVLWNGITNDGTPYLDIIPPELYDPRKKNETEMSLEFYNGSTLQFVGADRIKGWMGSNPRGVVFSEYSLTNPQAWDYLRPILRVNGGWAVFNLTPRGRNHAHRLYEMAKNNPAWFCEKLTIDQTTRHDGVTPVLYDSARPEHAKWIPILGPDADINQDRLEGMDEALIQQEYYCSFDGVMRGAIYTEALQAARARRITLFEVDPYLPVSTAWDLGMDDAMAIGWFQRVGGEHRLVDYHEDAGHGLDHYARLLQQRGMERKYRYEVIDGKILCHVPHDAKVRELGTGKSRVEIARTLGLHFRVVPKIAKKADGIAAVRRLFPTLWIHEKHGARLLDALATYRYEFDEMTQSWSAEPKHDWSSHGCDMLQTYALGVKAEASDRPATVALSRFDPLADTPEEFAVTDFNPVGVA